LVRLYLDLETYRPRDKGSFVDERIISSGFLIDETPYQEDSLCEDIKPILIKEWDGLDERAIVIKAQDYVKEMLESYRFAVLKVMNFPHLLILDEPTDAVDSENIPLLLDYIAKSTSEINQVILATHMVMERRKRSTT